MTKEDIDALFEHNASEIDKMHVTAGSMVKQIIWELERKNRNTYIRLKNATVDGHSVQYEFVEGDRSLVGRAARALGFKTVTDSLLEVHSG